MDGAMDINRRRLLAGLSGVAGCGANGYQIDGEPFSLTQFPQIPLKPMENDPPELVANFEFPSGGGSTLIDIRRGLAEPNSINRSVDP